MTIFRFCLLHLPLVCNPFVLITLCTYTLPSSRCPVLPESSSLASQEAAGPRRSITRSVTPSKRRLTDSKRSFTTHSETCSYGSAERRYRQQRPPGSAKRLWNVHEEVDKQSKVDSQRSGRNHATRTHQNERFLIGQLGQDVERIFSKDVKCSTLHTRQRCRICVWGVGGGGGVCVCVRACVRACVHASARACVCVCVFARARAHARAHVCET